MSDIASKVKAIIVDKLVIDQSEVTNDSNFMSDLADFHRENTFSLILIKISVF